MIAFAYTFFYFFLGSITLYACHKVLQWSQNTSTKDGLDDANGGLALLLIAIWPINLLIMALVVAGELSARIDGKLHVKLFHLYDQAVEFVINKHTNNKK